LALAYDALLLENVLQVTQRSTTSSEPRLGDQKQPRPDRENPEGSRDDLTCGRETLDGDGARDHRHRQEIHDTDDQEDGHQPGAAVAAVKAEAQAMPPGRARIGRQRMAAPRRFPAAGQVARLPRGELE